jgi:hypothetical protein
MHGLGCGVRRRIAIANRGIPHRLRRRVCRRDRAGQSQRADQRHRRSIANRCGLDTSIRRHCNNPAPDKSFADIHKRDTDLFDSDRFDSDHLHRDPGLDPYLYLGRDLDPNRGRDFDDRHGSKDAKSIRGRHHRCDPDRCCDLDCCSNHDCYRGCDSNRDRFDYGLRGGPNYDPGYVNGRGYRDRGFEPMRLKAQAPSRPPLAPPWLIQEGYVSFKSFSIRWSNRVLSLQTTNLTRGIEYLEDTQAKWRDSPKITTTLNKRNSRT